MVLEATFLCVDNSEHMRNGDLSPTRLGAVYDACNLVCGAKTNSNAENTVGLLTMAGKHCEIRESLTNELPRLYAAMAGINVQGALRFAEGVHIAALGLKHRQNKQQRQRVVCFVGSPVTESEKELEQLGKVLKKTSVAIDVVSFGCEENTDKLKAFIAAANSSDNSHLIEVPAGVRTLADILVSSPVIATDGEPPPTLGVGGGDIDFGDDPELAMALRLSMEEERKRQEEANKGEGGEGGGGGSSAPAAAAPMAAMSDEDEMLALALKMSMEEAAGGGGGGGGDATGGSAEPASTTDEMKVDGEGELDDDAALALAMKMSVEKPDVQDGVDDLMNDPAFMENLAKEVKKKEDDEKK
eukprot:TRINITY_DN62868_c0_g1_i1.p1 TRINITY_DN62868_c0_g1~~TRINITY_DN62868_c0_g1_i1.p1  ORF type:complete len:357 (-),score=94.35 TRINITY_DN62868_c0_g1_i1:730-1800(-)